MALYEYFCEPCQKAFEQLTSSSDPDRGRCPLCGSAHGTHRLISRFAVGGRGDLRESTWDGCHGPASTDSADSGPREGSGHVHHAGCGHGGHSDSD